jgi:hypothetical protein
MIFAKLIANALLSDDGQFLAAAIMAHPLGCYLPEADKRLFGGAAITGALNPPQHARARKVAEIFFAREL